MTIDVMAFAVGAVLVLTAILGGGFEVKELKVPRVGPFARTGAALFGTFFVLLGLGLGDAASAGSDGPAAAASSSSQGAPAAAASPVRDPVQVPVGAPSPATAFVPGAARPVEPVQPAPASDAWLDQVHAQLEEYDQWARMQGLSRSHEFQSGSAHEGEEQTIALQLDGGYAYGILGVCDEDCADLDLQLLDGNGYVLVEDFEVDAHPQLLVQAPFTGTYYASVYMASCTAAPCRYGVAIYRQ